MLILRILRKENRIPPPRMALMMGLAGASNALILSTINSAAQHAGQNGPDLRLLAMFALCLLVYIIAQRHVMSAAMCEIDTVSEGASVGWMSIRWPYVRPFNTTLAIPTTVPSTGA